MLIFRIILGIVLGGLLVYLLWPAVLFLLVFAILCGLALLLGSVLEFIFTGKWDCSI
jgi:hypothetical protein